MTDPSSPRRDDGDDRASAATLCTIDRLGARRLARVLRHHRPGDALARLRTGEALHDLVERAIPPADLRAIRRAAAGADPGEVARRCRSVDVAVTHLGADDYPVVLAADPDPAPVLFFRGRLDALAGRRVGVVGTRNATAAGLATATELGYELAQAGVTVVSGLARGVDGAVHRGVRDAGGAGRPVAIVGSGLDVPYPRQHVALWDWVASCGALVSEWPPGTQPDAWRFPQRNRIIAAASEVVVVVESRTRGGSLITARLALDRDVEVMAVPGSPRSPASAGTNALLVDGAMPVTSVDDVLTALSLDHRHAAPGAGRPVRPTDPVASSVVAAVEADGAATLDRVAAVTGLPITAAALALARLERDGMLAEVDGWFEPCASRLEGCPTEPRDAS